MNYTDVARIFGQRTRPLVYWDAQNLAPAVADVERYDSFIRNAVQQRVFPQWERPLFKAWVSQPNGGAAKKLQELHWRVSRFGKNCDEAICRESPADAGEKPQQSAVFLITRDGDYVDLIHKLQGWQVAVYLIAPNDASDDLVNAVGSANWIRLYLP